VLQENRNDSRAASLDARLTSTLSSIFARPMSSGTFVPAVDGLRFYAIAAVMLYHAYDFGTAVRSTEAPEVVDASLRNLGPFGVHLFFAISGFVLALPFAKARMFGTQAAPRLRAYFVRRISRIEPPYFINLLVRSLLLIAARGDTVSSVLPHLLASVFYVHNIAYGRGSDINPVAWSLEVEVQFYLLAPLLAGVFSLPVIRRRVVVVGTIIAFSALRSTLLDGGVGLTLFHNLQYFAVGFLLVDLHLCGSLKYERALDVVGIASWCALPLIAALDLWRSFGPLMILGAFAAGLGGQVFRRAAEHPLTVTVGGMCYSLYLYHYLVLSSVGRALFDLSPMGNEVVDVIALSFLLTALMIAACSVTYVLAERPFMRRDWWRRKVAE
jgi:peptidoglycan/LPS O-acetylase OafA/YrhL